MSIATPNEQLRAGYAAFSELGEDLGRRQMFASCRLLPTQEWEIGFGPVRVGLFADFWETRTGRDLAAVCADVRREVGD